MILSEKQIMDIFEYFEIDKEVVKKVVLSIKKHRKKYIQKNKESYQLFCEIFSSRTEDIKMNILSKKELEMITNNHEYSNDFLENKRNHIMSSFFTKVDGSYKEILMYRSKYLKKMQEEFGYEQINDNGILKKLSYNQKNQLEKEDVLIFMLFLEEPIFQHFISSCEKYINN
ncbi:MAG: hypothetical protein ACRC4M_05110 [Mycoplasma sp.]